MRRRFSWRCLRARAHTFGRDERGQVLTEYVILVLLVVVVVFLVPFEYEGQSKPLVDWLLDAVNQYMNRFLAFIALPIP